MALSFLTRWFGSRNTTGSKMPPNALPSSEAESQFQKGLMFATSPGEILDYVQAAQWYGQAAEQNHSLAQFNLAVMYDQGQGVERDEAKSLMWMTRAAELGDPAAQFKLGLQQHKACRSGSVEAVHECRIEALKWMRLSASQGYRGAERACEFVALGMTLEEVAEVSNRASTFLSQKGT